MYVKQDKHGNVVQLRIFKDRKAAIDFDWGHPHGKHPRQGLQQEYRSQSGFHPQ